MANDIDYTDDLLIDLGPKTSSATIIKVIGVGGGGGNAVNHMYKSGPHDVNFVVCNTDSKALESSAVPNRVQLGEGLGAGNKPEKAKKATEDSIESVRDMLNDGTKMVFITAGMGGGTGTGAAPIIAREARNLGILTVGIVTIPFAFEGKKKIRQALTGVQDIAKHVDALLIVNNERLREIYPDLTLRNAFAHADDTLSIAVRSISEIITMRGIINLDFEDVSMVLLDGGVAVMSTGYGEGSNRVTKAIEDALHSPLLNNNDIYNSKKILFHISFCTEDEQQEMRVDEINELQDFMDNFNEDVEVKWGVSIDKNLGDKIKITILASGFGIDEIDSPGEPKVIEEPKPINKANEDHIIELINKHYPTGKRGESTYRSKVHIFTLDDLDNDELISHIEAKPVYQRRPDTMKEIRSKSIHLPYTMSATTFEPEAKTEPAPTPELTTAQAPFVGEDDTTPSIDMSEHDAPLFS